MTDTSMHGDGALIRSDAHGSVMHSPLDISSSAAPSSCRFKLADKTSVLRVYIISDGSMLKQGSSRPNLITTSSSLSERQSS